MEKRQSVNLCKYLYFQGQRNRQTLLMRCGARMRAANDMIRSDVLDDTIQIQM